MDVIFTDVSQHTSFPRHEEFGRAISQLLNKAPDFAAAAEFIIRRCYYHVRDGATHTADVNLDNAEVESGFGITIYLYGYGDDAAEAKQRWTIALKVLQNALVQLSARERRGG